MGHAPRAAANIQEVARGRKSCEIEQRLCKPPRPAPKKNLVGSPVGRVVGRSSRWRVHSAPPFTAPGYSNEYNGQRTFSNIGSVRALRRTVNMSLDDSAALGLTSLIGPAVAQRHGRSTSFHPYRFGRRKAHWTGQDCASGSHPDYRVDFGGGTGSRYVLPSCVAAG